jgi:chitodextrinase
MLTSSNRPHSVASIRALVRAVAAAALIALAVSAAPAAAGTGPVASYSFNERAGSVLPDLSGNGNNGTVINGSWSSGKYGNSLHFNGSSSRVTVPSSASLSAYSAMTIDAWVRPSSLGTSWRDIAIKQQPGELTYGLYANSNVKAPAGIVYTGGSEKTDYGAGTLPLNAWSYVATTYDGAVLAVYINGNLSSTQFVSGPIATSSGTLEIGGNTVWGEWFAGRIDELRVYNRALTRSEISSDMQSPVAGPSSSADTTPPSTPTGLSASATQTSVNLSWSASTDNVAVAGYTAYTGSAQAGTTASTSYAISGLSCGTTYTFAVDAFDTSGNHSSKATVTKTTSACTDTQAPTAPTGAAASGSTPTSIALGWTASTDNVGVAGYTVYNGGNQAGTTNGTTYTVAGLACGKSYTLAVDAYDAAGNHSAKTTVTASTAACPSDSTAPTSPAGLSATPAQTSVTLGWTPSTDNVGVTGYTVYNGGNQAGTTNGTTYTVTGLTCATSYTFAVDAYDAAGNHSTKSSVSTTTGACPDSQAPSAPSNVSVTGSTTGSLSMSWSASTDNVGVTGYTVYNAGNQVGTTNGTSYTVTGLACGATYTLSVDAFDALGNHSSKTNVTGSTAACPDGQAPTVPGSVAVSSKDATTATLTWTASTDNVGVAGYTVYNGSNTAGTTAGTSYTVTGLSCGSTYTIAVDAFDAAGNHSAKSSVTVTTSACSGPATLYLSPSGSDSNPCSQAAPCRSFDRGYHLAAPGQTVVVAAGSYGDQAISADAAKASAASDVVLQAAGSVSVHLLDVNGAKHLTLDGFTVTRYSASQAAAFVTFKNIQTGSFYITNATDLKILGGSVGPWDSNVLGLGEDPEIGTQQSPQPNNILIKGVSFHDILNTSDPTAHADCLQFTSGTNVTIVGNSFRHCGNDADVYIRGDFGPVANFTVENNFFGASQGFFSLRLSGQSGSAPPCTNFLIANNSGSRGSVNPSGGTGDEMWGNCTAQGTSGVRWIGNITGSMSNSDCNASTSVGETWDHNISIAGAGCGTNATVANVSYVNPSEDVLDLHLTGSSNPAANYIPQTTTHAPDDYDGQTRPTTGPTDAGADEIG